jgi:hypothetical protein
VLGKRPFHPPAEAALGIRSLDAPAQVSTSRLQKLSYRHSLGSCCVEKGAVPSDHDDVWIVDPVGSRQVDSVIPAQLTNLSQLAGAAGEGVIDFDKIDLFEQGVELGDGVAQLAGCEAAKSLSLSESSACLWMHEADAHNAISTVPQRRGASGAGLSNQQRHHR